MHYHYRHTISIQFVDAIWHTLWLNKNQEFQMTILLSNRLKHKLAMTLPKKWQQQQHKIVRTRKRIALTPPESRTRHKHTHTHAACIKVVNFNQIYHHIRPTNIKIAIHLHKANLTHFGKSIHAPFVRTFSTISNRKTQFTTWALFNQREREREIQQLLLLLVFFLLLIGGECRNRFSTPRKWCVCVCMCWFVVFFFCENFCD